MKAQSQAGFPSLKTWQLKYFAFLLGLPSTGTKAELGAVLKNRFHQSDAVLQSCRRIVSVDMGIRNLAYCVLEQPDLRKAMTVSTWKRVDLLDSASVADDGTHTNDTKRGGRRQVARSLIHEPIIKTAFTPPSLSKTAYNVTAELLTYEPTSILIERQRFRSAGGASIQEWTVRVNMLESMLWACLETMRQSDVSVDDRFPALHEVSPKRVAHFWTAAPDVGLRPPNDLSDSNSSAADAFKPVRKKVEKKEKIAIVRSWLEGNEDVRLEFKGDAADIVNMFKRSASRRVTKKDQALVPDKVKLDDLADCLLQAVAWVRWQENAEKIRLLLAGALP